MTELTQFASSNVEQICFEHGDAADPFIEDECKMRTLMALSCSMDTGRLVSGQFRGDVCMKKKSIIDHL